MFGEAKESKGGGKFHQREYPARQHRKRRMTSSEDMLTEKGGVK
jgi:hypothetical protein